MTVFAPTQKAAPRRRPLRRMKIGDRVLVEGQEGLVVGVRYGAPAYDVLINGVCLPNLAPDSVRPKTGSTLIHHQTAA